MSSPLIGHEYTSLPGLATAKLTDIAQANRDTEGTDYGLIRDTVFGSLSNYTVRKVVLTAENGTTHEGVGDRYKEDWCMISEHHVCNRRDVYGYLP